MLAAGAGIEIDADEDAIQPEPYFVRNRSGRREKELPDIRNYLPAAQ